MAEYPVRSCTAFADTRCIATGDVADVAIKVKTLVDAGDSSTVLVFDDETARPVELDLRGSIADVAARHVGGPDAPASLDAAATQAFAPRGPGRPKLGVVAREITLLPRHWEWLASQPGGASVTLRKLVERARKEGSADERTRNARDVTYRFALAIAGNEPGFEEAMRALYAGDREHFEARISAWPTDVRVFAVKLATDAFASPGDMT